MILTSYSGTTQRGSQRGAQHTDTTRGAFFTPEDTVEEAPKKPPIKRVSVEALQAQLGLTGRQAKDLAALANVDYQEPFRAGRLKTDDGEVFLVTQQNSDLDPKGFQGYEGMFRVYAMEGNQVQEMPVSHTHYTRSGDVTLEVPLGKSVGKLEFPAFDSARILGRSLSQDVDGSKISE